MTRTISQHNMGTPPSTWLGRNRAQLNIVFMTILILGPGQSAYLKSQYLMQQGLPIQASDLFSVGDTSFSLVSTVIVVALYLLIGSGLRKIFRENAVRTRYALQFALSALLGGAAAATSLIFYSSVLHDYPVPETYVLVNVAVVAFMAPVALIAALETFHYRGAWLKEQFDKEQMQREIISTQFEALKNQLSPHFVFNSFNSLSALIEEDPARAQLFLNQLSQVYRYILDNKDRETVLLGQELDSVMALLDVQEARHPDTVKIVFDIKPSDRALRVIPLTLHTLLENVFKHNTLSKTAPINLTIKAVSGNMLVVENNIKPKLDVESHHIGIDNLSRRYEILIKQGLTVLKNTHTFRVEIPFVNEKAHVA